MDLSIHNRRDYSQRPAPVTEADKAQQQITGGNSKKIEYDRCLVCGSPCNREHLNYGGKACNGCRAFFRRTYQKTRTPKFQCMNDPSGSCNLLLKTRKRKCRHCRLTLCLAAGMRMDKVLAEEEKRVRFRKALSKQEEDDIQKEKPEKQSSSGSGSESEETKVTFKRKHEKQQSSSEEEEDEDDEEKAKIQKLKQEEEIIVVKLEPEVQMMEVPRQWLLKPKPELRAMPPLEVIRKKKTESVFGGDSKEAQQMEQEGKIRSLRYLKKTDLMRLHHVQETWSRALSKFQPSDEFLDHLLAFHSHACHQRRMANRMAAGCIVNVTLSAYISDRVLKEFANQLMQLVYTFALEQPEVIFMEEAAQFEVLRKAAPLFMQYIFGRYLTADTSREQLRWLLIGKEPSQRFVDRIRDAREIHCEELLDEMEDSHHLALLDELTSMRLPLWSSGVVALMCLVGQDSEKFKSTHLIKTLESVCSEASDKTFRSADVFLDTLENLSRNYVPILGFLNTWDEWSDIPKALGHITLRYSTDEETWFQRKLSVFTNALDSVNMGSDMMHELLMFSQGQRVSTTFHAKYRNMVLERLKQTVIATDEFQLLSMTEQKALMVNNLADGLTLAASLVENCTTGEEQLTHFLGLNDRTMYEDHYRSFLPPHSLRKISSEDVVDDNLCPAKAHPEKMLPVVQLMSSIANFASDRERYAILSHLVMFSSDLSGNPAIQIMRGRFFTVLFRRYRQSHGSSNAALRQSSLRSLRDLRRASRMMQQWSRVYKERLNDSRESEEMIISGGKREGFRPELIMEG